MSDRTTPQLLGRAALVLLATLVLLPQPGTAQLQWTSKDEKLTFKVGILGQLQADSVDVAGTDDQQQNLFLRRARILMNFTLGEKLSVFFETDSPNLGKGTGAANASFNKDAGDVFIQDFVVAYKLTPTFQLEGGMILPALSYNHMQSAATLLAMEYGPYTFTESTPLQARVGRDYGLQVRGYAADNHLEYRAGVFQGLRGVNASNNFRYYGRLMYQAFTPQTGLFYRGTSLGKTKSLAIGASYDVQEDYTSYAGDLFFDLPIGGNGLTLQADLQHFDGDVFTTAIPQQDDLLFELGFYIAAAKLMPFVQYAAQDFDAPARIDETRTSIGLGYYASGWNNNFKIAYTRIEPDLGKTRDQFTIQWQIFQF